MKTLNASNSSFFSQTSPDILATSTVLGLCCLLGLPGNLAVLVMLTPCLKKGSFTPKLMLSLAVSDLLSLSTLPVWIYSLLYGWIFGQVLCKLFSYVVYWSLYSSVLSVTLISVQRYLQVLYPQRWAKLGGRGQKGLICGIWTCSGLLACYALYFRDVVLKEDNLLHCFQEYGTIQEQNAVLLVETCVMFVVPTFSLLCSYLRLHRRVSQSVSFSTNRLTKLSVRIVVVFFIFSTPCVVSNLVKMAVSTQTPEITGALFFMNSCVNPFLYGFSASSVRQNT